MTADRALIRRIGTTLINRVGKVIAISKFGGQVLCWSQMTQLWMRLWKHGG